MVHIVVMRCVLICVAFREPRSALTRSKIRRREPEQRLSIPHGMHKKKYSRRLHFCEQTGSTDTTSICSFYWDLLSTKLSLNHFHHPRL
ncbi:hypothetical protein BJ165DRAFT_1511385 [Panaeolus papilionaceus]|nr:hypothetical protein BJ165DRAFT_1511385 [Panaeolus papilionaceus]